MKKYNLLSFFLLLFCSVVHAQVVFNLDFEKRSDPLPEGWIKWGMSDFFVGADTLVANTGKVSGVVYSLSHAAQGSFGSIACALPAKYEGKHVTLE